MTPEKQIKKLQEIKLEIERAKTYRKGWGEVIKELKQQLDDLIDGQSVEQLGIMDRLPPRPKAPE